MNPQAISKFAALVAVCLLALSTAVYAGGNGGKNGNGNRNNDGNRNHQNNDSSILLPFHDNGCAVGNKPPPPGANCTNRDTSW
ncbi:hypothetical protein JJB09_22080 [Rhizobium sp. KVB221]|uniref:Transmembrane anchored protein n=1 Tax=Rhizobium setariae TaxID=2801340 RepID=A0A937CPB0_9HYPH|nr:hypothetical protein [Rhizobium setariae]MBL0374706.1 hypothetical protein [Rhizobium setariae]